ncbi:rhodanese-like domain-containing protein [Clostridium sp. CCUG 7971]|uniref:rhodanese-like domain-containing protein n=1 Tax=Clostridium sp. CCUG 7971 TaxID=2811414 RepID=UPI001ABA28C4|nr:rhodanese-like domain-containing protein [Clostridium sp. CCUG 7971]MBO3446021.1 rhodanese-like domain-containing protein [Clostridium sp. CCUG 7971]
MNFKNIGKNELKKIIENKEDIFLLDIRTKEEYEEGNINTSVNIPLQNLLYDIDDIEEYKDKKVVVYCRSGHRSITACNILSMSGFTDLYNLEKGIIDYKL